MLYSSKLGRETLGAVVPMRTGLDMFIVYMSEGELVCQAFCFWY